MPIGGFSRLRSPLRAIHRSRTALPVWRRDELGDKRDEKTTTADLKESNRRWWQSNPGMTYDWRHAPKAVEFSEAWFDEVDAKQLAAYDHLTLDGKPFGRLMPLERLAGRRVLRSGVGWVCDHNGWRPRGAKLTSIDLTDRAVDATRQRLKLRGLQADVRSMDAEHLEFPNGSFDLVWSWGVIHHSASTSSIVREISRVLAPEGECRIMVYNRDGWPARMSMLRSMLKPRALAFDDR